MIYSIIMTVYNRPELMLLNTLMGLAKNDLTDTEIVIVNDGSTLDYSSIERSTSHLPIRWVETDTCAERPGTYNIKGCNNPAYAFNRGIDESRGDVVFIMSSDVIVPPPALGHLKRRNYDETAACTKVVDMDTGLVYLGFERVFPVPFFMGAKREHWGRYDEEYLKGIAFEDNDIAGQVCVAAGKMSIDTDIVAFHQSHPNTAYSDDLKGWRINKAYCEGKWGGIPWDGTPKDPIVKEPHVVAGTIIIKCSTDRVPA